MFIVSPAEEPEEPMAATTTKPKETWRSWMPEGVPEPELVTRDELVMRDENGHIVGRTMIGWQDFLNPEQSERLGRMEIRVRAEDS